MSGPGQLDRVADSTLSGRRVLVWRCRTCGTDYTADPYRGLTCNGHRIDVCPWCRPDSRPWSNGRGR